MEFDLIRPDEICSKAIVIDGLPGCGKTMLSALIGTLDRVELMKYSYEIESLCFLNHFNKLNQKTTASMIQYQLDLILYNQMMARETNFRFKDLSSVFRSVHKLKYIKRLFGPGDELVPELIEKENPIVHLVTHCLSAYANPLLDNFKGEMLLINFHRNPLYMIKQNLWNMENLLNSKRDFRLYYKWNGKRLPNFFYGQEERMLKANSKEKVIFFLEWSRKNALKNDLSSFSKNYYELSFESFVKDPYLHIEEITTRLRTQVTKQTPKILKREKIPRKILSHGRDLPIYRRVNWKKTNAKNNEEEINTIYNWVISDISQEAKASIDWLINDYKNIVNRLSL
jgi:hypothetical protein